MSHEFDCPAIPIFHGVFSHYETDQSAISDKSSNSDSWKKKNKNKKPAMLGGFFNSRQSFLT